MSPPSVGCPCVSAQSYPNAMDGAVVDDGQSQRPLRDLDPVDFGEAHAAADSGRIVDDDVVARRFRSGATNPGARTRPQLSRLARHAAAQLRQSSAADVANRRTDHHRRQMRGRSLRHGDAGSARSLPAHLGRRPGSLSDGGGASRPSGIHLPGGGLLGSRMDAATAGLRLLLRQEAL
jgi:hypothetical protein